MRRVALRFLALPALWMIFCAAGAQAADSLLLNGHLTSGSGNAPDGWKSSGFRNDPAVTTYSWIHSAGAPGELEISSTKPNDACWSQNVHLPAGWYRISASIRAEGVSSGAVGANLSILEDGIISEELRGTTDWQAVDFHLKVGEAGADVLIACRLGELSNLNTGKAFCRGLQAVKVDAPPAGAKHIYDLDVIRGPVTPSSTPPTGPSSRSNPLAITILFAAAALLVAMLLFGGRLQPALRRLRQSRPHRAPPIPEPAPRDEPDLADTLPAEAVEPVSEPPAYSSPDYLPIIAVTGAVIFVTLLAIHRLDGTPHDIRFRAAFAGLRNVLATTGVAAIKIWSFWALGTIVVGGLLLQIDPEMDLVDAVLGGAGGLWALAYFLGQLLGPIHLFRAPTFWILLAAAVFQLWRKPPVLRSFKLSTGQKLALLAFGLFSIGMIPLELGSPVAPYMDVLGAPGSVQRILSFGVYRPFDNDPYGCFGARAQVPGFELFLTMLASASHVNLGILAQSGMIVPMGAMVIFATYRLGLTLANDFAGGVAALFLFFTVLFRRLTGMRGTAVAFVMVGFGLAFFLDRRRGRTLTALGAILLGTSVAVHAIDGGLAVLTAGVGTLLWLAEGDSERFVTGILCLLGSVLFAFPELAIGIGKPVPYPLLPISQIAGIGVVLFAVRRMQTGEASAPQRVLWLSRGLVVLLVAAMLFLNATTRDSMFESIISQYPLLFIFALGGIVIWAALEGSLSASSGAAIVAFALLMGVVDDVAKGFVGAGGNEVLSSGVGDIAYKLEEFWCPYFMVFPAAIPFAALYRSRAMSRYLVILAALVLLIYPWYPRFDVDDNYNEHSISDEWGVDLGTAANGYWFGTHDARWAMGPDDFALVDFLRNEQASGRITPRTHILHIAHDAIVWRDFNRYAVYTGIDDDPFVYEILSSDAGWFAGSRVNEISALRRALTEHPPYILEQVDPPSWMKNPPDGYEEVFNRESLRLFRRKHS